MYDLIELADSGSTGDVTHTGVRMANYETLALCFEVESIGATPTVDFKFQGSLDGTNWYDLSYVTDASDTAAVAARTVTAVGQFIQFPSNVVSRRYQFIRLVTASNTNVTYTAYAYRIHR